MAAEFRTGKKDLTSSFAEACADPELMGVLMGQLAPLLGDAGAASGGVGDAGVAGMLGQLAEASGGSEGEAGVAELMRQLQGQA